MCADEAGELRAARPQRQHRPEARPDHPVAARVRYARHENASAEDAIAVADSYSANSTFTPTRQLNVTSPTASNIAMGLFDDIVPPDTASGYGPLRITVRPKSVEPPPAPPQPYDMPADVGLAPNPFEPWDTGEDPRGKVTPSPRRGLFDDIMAPAVRLRAAGLSFDDGEKILRRVAAPGTSAFIHDDDPPAPRAVNGTSEHHSPLASAARAGGLAQHKAAVESALSNTVPFRLQHPRPLEIAARLMAGRGMPLDEALDRATMRLHAEEGAAEAGKISDVIGKDAFDEAQRAPASPDLAPPAPGVGRGLATAEEQARPDGEYASGDSALQGGDAAAGKAIGSEDPVRAEQRAQSGDELISAAAEGEGGDQGLASGRNDVLARTSGEQHVLPTAERIGDDESQSPPARENLLWRLASPLTDILHEIYQAGAESLGAVNSYLNPFSEDYRNGMEADRDKWIGTGPGSFLGTGKGLLAAIGVPFSPATGIFRSLIGHPLSVIMPTATPQEQERMRKAGIPENMIPGRTREENYQKAKRDVDRAMMAARPFGVTPRGAIARSGPQPPARPPDAAAAQSDQMNSQARVSGPFDSARPAEATTLGSRVAAESGGATFGIATSKRYRTTFFEPNRELRGQVVVHHAVEQRVLKEYPGVVTDAEMHSLENLRGIPRHLNSELHLKQVRREWNQFYREYSTPTREQLLQKASEIDARYGSQFNPPIKPGR